MRWWPHPRFASTDFPDAAIVALALSGRLMTINNHIGGRHRPTRFLSLMRLVLRGPLGQRHEPRATSHEPRATSHEPRATSHEPRATSQCGEYWTQRIDQAGVWAISNALLWAGHPTVCGLSGDKRKAAGLRIEMMMVGDGIATVHSDCSLASFTPPLSTGGLPSADPPTQPIASSAGNAPVVLDKLRLLRMLSYP
jgi:hypothetical protein